jgi:hypothetical protein
MTLRRLEKRGLKVAVQVIRHCQVDLFRRRYKGLLMSEMALQEDSRQSTTVQLPVYSSSK